MARESYRAWSIAFLLFLGQVINFFDKGVLGLAAVPIMKELRLSPADYGYVASSFYALYAISGLCVGFFVVSRVPSRRLLAVLVLIWSLSQLPIVLTSSLVVLVACRVLLGIGEGPGTPTILHTCYEWFPNERRNLATALIMVGPGFGTVISAPILTFLILAYGWRSAFLLCAGLGLAWLLAWMLLGGEGPHAIRRGTVAVASHETTAEVPYRTLWLDPTLVGSVIVGFCAYWVTGFTVSWMAPYLQLGLGYDLRTTGRLMPVISGTGSCVILLVSWLSQRALDAGLSSRQARGLVNGGCLLAAAVLLFGAMATEAPGLKVALLAVGLGLPSVTFSLGPAIVGEAVLARQRGHALLVVYSVVTFAGFLSPMAAARLIAAAGPEAIGAGFRNALLLVGAVLVVGGVAAVALLRPEETRRRFADFTADGPSRNGEREPQVAPGHA